MHIEMSYVNERGIGHINTMNKDSKIYIAGHNGLVGSAIHRLLQKEGFINLIVKRRCELNLTNQQAVHEFFLGEKPEYVFLAAAKVGGIYANNTYPADFIRDNIQIQTNIIDSAYCSGVKKLLFLGSSCIYPKLSPQPMKETDLLSSYLEPTNQWYAIAKIAGLMMCQAYKLQYGFNAISLMPTNLYGPGDNFHEKNSHVLPALIRRFHEAKLKGDKKIVVWGTGAPRREFLHADDLAFACLFLMKNYNSDELINVGVGEDVSIFELAELIKKVIGFDGEILLDTSMPDGPPQKLLDISKIKTLGWKAKINLENGIRSTYDWYLDHIENFRGG
jgi:GDP-L-fucose synthase